MNIAIIGNGKITESLAIGLAASGHNVWIGSTDNKAVYSNFIYNVCGVEITSIEEAAELCDVVFITTGADDVREVAYRIDDVKQKVVVDMTSFNQPLFSGNTNTMNAIKAITGSQRVVKCYSCNGHSSFTDPLLKNNNIDIFLAGDDRRSKEMAKLIFNHMGFAECHDFGDDAMIPQLDGMAASWANISQNQKPGEAVQFALVKK